MEERAPVVLELTINEEALEEHDASATTGLAKLEVQGLVRRCPRCQTPTEHSGGCPRMLCAICGERWEWGSQAHWGSTKENEILTPAEARQRYEAFLHGESMDKQIAIWIMCLPGIVAIMWVALHFGPDWRACLSWLAVFHSAHDWIQEKLFGLCNALVHPQSPAEVTASLVVLMMMVGGLLSMGDILLRQKAKAPGAARRGVRGSSADG